MTTPRRAKRIGLLQYDRAHPLRLQARRRSEARGTRSDDDRVRIGHSQHSGRTCAPSLRAAQASGKTRERDCATTSCNIFLLSGDFGRKCQTYRKRSCRHYGCPSSPRYVALTLAWALTLAFASLIGSDMISRWDIPLAIGFLVCLFLGVLGLRDLVQTKHSVLRTYPISAHLRFLLETIRPEMRQYFFESETDGLPFSRSQRAVVYQRAKMQLDKRPFGTQLDPGEVGYEWLRHSMAPADLKDGHPRIAVGGPDCRQPYSASVFNISAMSFGSL